MWSRRRVISAAVAAAGLAAGRSHAQVDEPLRAAERTSGRAPGASPSDGGGAPAATASRAHVPVVTPDGATLPWTMKDGVKEFQLIAEPVSREFAPGMTVKCWGYNGLTPGPTIEAVEGDRVRILVTNRLPEATSIHWHGILLPNGMDGVSGLNQPAIRPGETFAYEFTLRQNGTQMYHPHADEMLQMAVGMMGLFVIHPREPHDPPVDRDFAIMLHEWAIHPGTYRPDPAVMTDFNMFSFNGKVYPGTSPLVVRTGERVRIRLANLSMDSHPIHLHGFRFSQTGTDGGRMPASAQFLETTVNVPVGATRDIEFTADAPGDWILHCHKSHHTMNAMAHDLPNTLGVEPSGIDRRIRKLLPGYMSMGKDGMSEMQGMARHVKGPRNTLPMMNGVGPFGNIEMGGMFTIVKVRDDLRGYEDPGWYRNPPGTVAWRVGS
jgi:manganese oxidase